MENRPIERRLAAIMAADVVSYSRLMGADEVGTLRSLKAHRRELIDPAIAGYRGRIVKTTGDGMLVEFASVVDAVACAVAVQRGMLSRNAEEPEDKRVIFRIGINVGDIIIDGDDIFGDGVNIAARLESLCEPGGLCISRTANDQIRDKLALSFADLGEQTVKNIARAVGVFGLAAKDIAALPEEELPQAPATAKPAVDIAPRLRRRAVLFAAAAIVILIVAAGAWFVRQHGWTLRRERRLYRAPFDRRAAVRQSKRQPGASLRGRWPDHQDHHRPVTRGGALCDCRDDCEHVSRQADQCPAGGQGSGRALRLAGQCAAQR